MSKYEDVDPHLAGAEEAGASNLVAGTSNSGTSSGSGSSSEEDNDVLAPMASETTSLGSKRGSLRAKRHELTWQMSTPVSQARAEMVPEIAEMYKSILDHLGDNSTREGLLDTPQRAAKAMLFFTKV